MSCGIDPRAGPRAGGRGSPELVGAGVVLVVVMVRILDLIPMGGVSVLAVDVGVRFVSSCMDLSRSLQSNDRGCGGERPALSYERTARGGRRVEVGVGLVERAPHAILGGAA